MPDGRRRWFVQLAVLAALIAGATTAVAVLIPWLPQEASKQGERIDLTFWLATGIAIFIFSVVAATILFSVVTFRAHPDDDSDGPPIHGHTGLEIVWTMIPAALVTAIAIVSAVVLHDNGLAGRNPLKVKVVGQQFLWQFTYLNGPARGTVSPVLYLPLGRPTLLEITSVDVIHAFWVPQFRQQQDAVPGEVDPLVITPTALGTFPVICAELCGLGHTLMRSEATVLRPADFTAWENKHRSTPAPTPSATPSAPASPAVGKQVFTSAGCSSCHTFTPAGSTGKIGPNLNQLASYANKAGQPLAAYVLAAIIHPPAKYVPPGYPTNVMPTSFGQTLTPTQISALVAFLTHR